MKKVYVSIPITGEDYNDQRNRAFTVGTRLTQKGYDVVTPFGVVRDVTTPYSEAMGECVAALLECDAIYLCNGWQKSKGCNAELQVAIIYGKEVMTG